MNQGPGREKRDGSCNWSVEQRLLNLFIYFYLKQETAELGEGEVDQRKKIFCDQGNQKDPQSLWELEGRGMKKFCRFVTSRC